MALPFQFSGSLKDISLSEVVRLLRTTSRTGCLSLACPGGHGAIFLENGSIVEAQSSQLSGLDAIKLLAVFTQGSFEFTNGDFPHPKTLAAESTDALIEVIDARTLEAMQIRELIPQPHEIPYYLGGALPRNFELTASELAVVMQASSGMFNIEQLSERLGLDPLMVGYTIGRFRAIGLIEFREAGAVPARPPQIFEPGPNTSLAGAPTPEAPAAEGKPRYWRGRKIN